MKNFVANGESIQLPAPVGGVIGGDVYKAGEFVGIVVASALEGEMFTLKLAGIYSDIPKASATVFAIGDNAYWDNTAKQAVKTATSNTYFGKVTADAASGELFCEIRLDN